MHGKAVLVLAAIVLCLTACAKANDRVTASLQAEPPAASGQVSQVGEEESADAPADSGGQTAPQGSAPPAAQEPAPDAPYPYLERGSYEPAEWNDWQEDPSHDDMFWGWNHVEYRLFGPAEDYALFQREVGLFDRDGNILQDGGAVVEFRLPPLADNDSVINAHLGFAVADIKFGEIGAYRYALEEGEDPFAVEGGNFDRSTLTAAWGDPAPEIATRDNVVGGVCEGENYLRGIGVGPPRDNHQVNYYILVDEGHLMHLYFYVSDQATAEDLSLYDAVAESVRMVSETN